MLTRWVWIWNANRLEKHQYIIDSSLNGTRPVHTLTRKSLEYLHTWTSTWTLSHPNQRKFAWSPDHEMTESQTLFTQELKFSTWGIIREYSWLLLVRFRAIIWNRFENHKNWGSFQKSVRYNILWLPDISKELDYSKIQFTLGSRAHGFIPFKITNFQIHQKNLVFNFLADPYFSFQKILLKSCFPKTQHSKIKIAASPKPKNGVNSVFTGYSRR